MFELFRNNTREKLLNKCYYLRILSGMIDYSGYIKNNNGNSINRIEYAHINKYF